MWIQSFDILNNFQKTNIFLFSFFNLLPIPPFHTSPNCFCKSRLTCLTACLTASHKKSGQNPPTSLNKHYKSLTFCLVCEGIEQKESTLFVRVKKSTYTQGIFRGGGLINDSPPPYTYICCKYKMFYHHISNVEKKIYNTFILLLHLLLLNFLKVSIVQ